MPKPSFEKNSSDTIWFKVVRDKRVHAFAKVICLKVNVIARLEIELAHFDVAVPNNSHYATSTRPNIQTREKS